MSRGESRSRAHALAALNKALSLCRASSMTPSLTRRPARRAGRPGGPAAHPKVLRKGPVGVGQQLLGGALAAAAVEAAAVRGAQQHQIVPGHGPPVRQALARPRGLARARSRATVKVAPAPRRSLPPVLRSRRMMAVSWPHSADRGFVGPLAAANAQAVLWPAGAWQPAGGLC